MRPISTFAPLPALTDWHLGCALLGLGGSLLLPHPGVVPADSRNAATVFLASV